MISISSSSSSFSSRSEFEFDGVEREVEEVDKPKMCWKHGKWWWRRGREDEDDDEEDGYGKVGNGNDSSSLGRSSWFFVDEEMNEDEVDEENEDVTPESENERYVRE